MSQLQDGSEFVKSARSKLGMSQTEFADVLGVERRTIIRYENGDAVPQIARLAIEHLLSKARKRKRPK